MISATSSPPAPTKVTRSSWPTRAPTTAARSSKRSAPRSKERGLSLRQLQETTGINRAVWSQVERGKLLPTPEQIAALSDALEIPVAAWLIRFQLEARIAA